MPLITRLLLTLALIVSVLSGAPSSVEAGNSICAQTTVTVDQNSFDVQVKVNTRIDANRAGQDDGKAVKMFVDNKTITTTVQGGIATFNLGRLAPGGYDFSFAINTGADRFIVICSGSRDKASFNVPDVGQGGVVVPGRGTIEITPSSPRPNDNITVKVKNLPAASSLYYLSATQVGRAQNPSQCGNSSNGEVEFRLPPLSSGTWDVSVMNGQMSDGSCIAASGASPIATGQIIISRPAAPAPQSGCAQGASDCSSAAGLSCNPDNPDIGADGKPKPGGEGIWTAIGCVPTNPTKFTQGMIKLIMGAGGGIALLLMAAGAFQIMASAGNPDSLKKGQEQLTSAIVGLLFVIFSVLLLEIIGVDILGLDKLGTGLGR